jgi:hypothetical protein
MTKPILIANHRNQNDEPLSEAGLFQRIRLVLGLVIPTRRAQAFTPRAFLGTDLIVAGIWLGQRRWGVKTGA